MKHKINPMVDCVFKAILGSEKHKNLLIHFLNALLVPYDYKPIRDVIILNPYNQKEFESDKLTIVDIKALDEEEKKYQIEIHLSIEPGLKQHILFNWSDIYQNQLKEGESFTNLMPVISIWLLGKTLLKDSPAFHHKFIAYDPINKLTFADDFNIHILEIEKWNISEKEADEEDRWFYFFKEGKNIDIFNPPEILLTREMEEAMGVLKQFSEKQREYDLYRNRMRAMSMVASFKEALEEQKKQLEQKDQQLEQKDQQLEQKDQQLKEKDALIEELKQKLGDKYR